MTGEFEGSVVYPDGNMRGTGAKMVITEDTSRPSSTEYVGKFTLTLGNITKEGGITASQWEPGTSGGIITIDGVEIRVRPNYEASDPPKLRILNKKGEPRCFRFCPLNDRGCLYPPPPGCKKYIPPTQP